MRAFRELYLASLREYVRDYSALFWSLAFPILFIVIFGIIFSGGDDISFSIGLVNEDGDASAMLEEGFKQVEPFEITVGKREDELQALKDGDRRAVIIIPAGTGQQIGQAQPGEIDASIPLQVYYDPANTSTAQAILSIINQVTMGISQGITGDKPLLMIETQTIESQELRSIDYLLPGILAMSIMQVGLFATAAPVVQLREQKVLRRLGATPLRRITLLAAQVTMRLTIAVMQTLVIVFVGWLLFDVHLEFQNLPAIVGIVLLGALVFITFGYFLSTLAKTDEAVMGIVQLPNMLFMFLSGIFFPIDFMPDWIRPLVDAIPLTYLGDALRQLMVDAGGFNSMTTNVLVLGLWLVISTTLAVIFFKWE